MNQQNLADFIWNVADALRGQKIQGAVAASALAQS